MIVACSTLCFGKYPLERALRIIGELGFGRIDVALHEQGPHLKPSEVMADPAGAAQQLRVGFGLACCAFSVDPGTADEEEAFQRVQGVCRAARILNVPVLSVPAGPVGRGLDAEANRLSRLNTMAVKEGLILTVPTRAGTLTEDPDQAVALCQRVRGLGLTLDPSHYVVGPHGGDGYDQVLPYVRHVRLRDTGRGPNQFQVRVGQGEIEYGRLVSQLARLHYDRVLTVDIQDIPDAPFPMEPEVRKLKFLLESLT